MNRLPTVSVLIPTYNYARFLDDAIQSVLQQSFTDFELLIVDNCSTDNTDEVVKKYLADARVRFIKNEKNVGLVNNWNRCLDHASGTYIKFLCADDTFHPQLLQTFVPIMDEHQDVSLITTANELFGLRRKLRQSPEHGLLNGQHVRNQVIRGEGYNWLYSPTAVMFRKADVKKAGYFDTRLIALVDTEYWLRLLNGGNCYIVPDVLCYCRVHEATQSNYYKKRRFEKLFEVYRFMACVRAASQPAREITDLKTLTKKRAIRATAVLYQMLPVLYKKENRRLFKKAFRIGREEKMLLQPIPYYCRKYLLKVLKK